MAQQLMFRNKFSRRHWLKAGSIFAMATSLPKAFSAESEAQKCVAPIPQNHEPSNGGPRPYPIPWLDKNCSHNQPAMPNVELSSVYHFNGKLGRCNASTEWAQTARGISSLGARQQRITTTWQGNSGRHGKRDRRYSRTLDSQCSKDRRSQPTRFMIFIRRSRRKVFTGSRQFLRRGSHSARTARQLCSS